MSTVDQDQLFSEISQIIEQYKAEVSGTRKQWPRALKERVHDLREAGVSALDLARRSGLPYATVKSWDYGRQRRRGHFKQVKVAEARPKQSLTVKAPTVRSFNEQILRVSTAGGLTVEGLSFEQVVALLKGEL